MSQMRAMRIELRAIVVVIAVCASIFGLFLPAFTHSRHDGASSLASQQGDSHIACPELKRPSSAFGSSTAPANDRQSHQTQCPGCCLAALAASAVLPERVATLARPIRGASQVSYYASSSERKPETGASSAVNGARAPPTGNSIS